MKSYEDFIKEPTSDLVEFRHQYMGVFKKDNRARQSLNNTLETKYIAVFRNENKYKHQWKKDDIDWDGETFYIVTAKGRVLEHTNSEWGGIGVARV
jgi:hypothetical protein